MREVTNLSQSAQIFEPQLVRSELLLNADRYVLERDIIRPLEAGAGPLGLIMIDLEQKKRDVCKIQAETLIPKHSDMLKNWKTMEFTSMTQRSARSLTTSTFKSWRSVC